VTAADPGYNYIFTK